MRFIFLSAVLPLLAACGALPASGPSTGAIVSEPDNPAPSFDVVALTPQVADRLAANQFETFSSSFGSVGGPADLRIGIGDTVVVTIFEAASGGLFSGEGALAGSAKNITMPAQPVARDGTIKVPYVGQVRVAGLTPAQVQASIEAGLRDKAIDPQVIVSANGESSSVVLTGKAGNTGRIPLNLGGDRLLDVIATAGVESPPYETFIRVSRGSSSVTVSLARVIDDPSQNIFLRPDDQIYVFTDPQIYSTFGAVGNNSTVPLRSDKLTLVEAMGRAGWLQDSRANPHGVFIFRYEKPELYALVREGRRPPLIQTAGVPVVYQINLRDPNGFFTAQRFLIRDNDILYVTNAPSTDLAKFLGIITGTLGQVQSTAGFATTGVGLVEP
jgi:polysaccharide export outer membrane protein